MNKTIVILMLALNIIAQVPPLGPVDRPQLLDSSPISRPILESLPERLSTNLPQSLASPQDNQTQAQLLRRFTDTSTSPAPEVSRQQVQATITGETASQRELASIAQRVMAPGTLPQFQFGPAFNWLKCFTKRGLTWRKKNHSCSSGLDLVGCSSCNPYTGDTQCFQLRPILCIYRAYDVRPDYSLSNPFYEGWSGGHIKITPPVRGCYIYSKVHADAICRYYFGTGWGIASHHDGYYIWGMGGTNYAYGSWNWFIASQGGWNFYAYGNVATTPYNSYWTYIADQPGNCWN